MISHLQFFQQFLLVRAMISGSYKYSSKFSRDLGIFFLAFIYFIYIILVFLLNM